MVAQFGTKYCKHVMEKEIITIINIAAVVGQNELKANCQKESCSETFFKAVFVSR